MSESAKERADKLRNSDCPHSAKTAMEEGHKYVAVDVLCAAECNRCIATEIRAAESAARAEGYAAGLREGQERMRERAAVAAGEADYPEGSEYMANYCGDACDQQSINCAAAIRALEVEDGSG